MLCRRLGFHSRTGYNSLPPLKYCLYVHQIEDRKCTASDLTAREEARDLYTRPLIGCPSEPGFRFAAAIIPDPRCCSGLYPPFVSQATRQNGMYSQLRCCVVQSAPFMDFPAGVGRAREDPAWIVSWWTGPNITASANCCGQVNQLLIVALMI